MLSVQIYRLKRLLWALPALESSPVDSDPVSEESNAEGKVYANADKGSKNKKRAKKKNKNTVPREFSTISTQCETHTSELIVQTDPVVDDKIDANYQQGWNDATFYMETKSDNFIKNWKKIELAGTGDEETFSFPLEIDGTCYFSKCQEEVAVGRTQTSDNLECIRFFFKHGNDALLTSLNEKMVDRSTEQLVDTFGKMSL